MIRFSLSCDRDHDFEGWFRSNEDFDRQNESKLVTCPACGSHSVHKALMAPSVSTGRKKEKIALAMNQQQRQMMAQLKELTDKVRESADYVGDKFAEEARKIHYGETDPRGIYGQATPEEAKGLADEGVSFMPLPVFPEDQN